MYSSFRKIATARQIPPAIQLLLDFAFEVVSGRKGEAFAILEDLRKRLPSKNHYLILIDYLAQDTFSDDDKRQKLARKALIDSIDQYRLRQLKMEQ